jgi:hypothetical protein
MKEKILKILLIISVFVVSFVVLGQLFDRYAEVESFWGALCATFIFYFYYVRKQ